jgi:hypothetical protein
MFFICFIIIFHSLKYFEFRMYTKYKQINYTNPTQYESMMFWPFILLESKQSKLKI